VIAPAINFISIFLIDLLVSCKVEFEVFVARSELLLIARIGEEETLFSAEDGMSSSDD
jgi:hypothetical protein